MSEPLKVGDRVRYCKAWLDTPHMLDVAWAFAADVGAVTDATPDAAGCLGVRWDGDRFDCAATPGSLRRADG